MRAALSWRFLILYGFWASESAVVSLSAPSPSLSLVEESLLSPIEPACVSWDVVSRAVCRAQSGIIGSAVVPVHCPPQAVLGLQGCGFISRRLRGENEAYPNCYDGGKGGALSLSRSLGALGALGGSVTW